MEWQVVFRLGQLILLDQIQKMYGHIRYFMEHYCPILFINNPILFINKFRYQNLPQHLIQTNCVVCALDFCASFIFWSIQFWPRKQASQKTSSLVLPYGALNWVEIHSEEIFLFPCNSVFTRNFISIDKVYIFWEGQKFEKNLLISI